MGARKYRPEPPRYFLFDTDDCYKCRSNKRRKGCGGCKFLKKYVHEHDKRKSTKFVFLRNQKGY